MLIWFNNSNQSTYFISLAPLFSFTHVNKLQIHTNRHKYHYHNGITILMAQQTRMTVVRKLLLDCCAPFYIETYWIFTHSMHTCRERSCCCCRMCTEYHTILTGCTVVLRWDQLCWSVWYRKTKSTESSWVYSFFHHKQVGGDKNRQVGSAQFEEGEWMMHLLQSVLNHLVDSKLFMESC